MRRELAQHGHVSALQEDLIGDDMYTFTRTMVDFYGLGDQWPAIKNWQFCAGGLQGFVKGRCAALVASSAFWQLGRWSVAGGQVMRQVSGAGAHARALVSSSSFAEGARAAADAWEHRRLRAWGAAPAVERRAARTSLCAIPA